LEESTLAKTQRDYVLRILDCFRRTAASNRVRCRCGAVHDSDVGVERTRRSEFCWGIVSVLCRKALLNLDATPVAVHVAEATDVHENVEAELLPGTEAAQHLVVASAMAQTGIYYFSPTTLTQIFDNATNLTIRVGTVGVEQRRGELDL